MNPEEPDKPEQNKRAGQGSSWLFAGIVLFFLGVSALGGGYAFTFLSIPLFLTALFVGSRSIRIVAIILLLAALGSTWSLYKDEKQYWPPKQGEDKQQHE